jgi:hypothetical protein
MRRFVCMLVLSALLAVVLPAISRADTINLVNQFGTVTITNNGIVSNSSELFSFNAIQAPKGRSLGFVNFATGSFIAGTGSIWTGGEFSSTGSMFDVKSNGVYGQPKGLIFQGSFEGPIDWTLVVANHQYHEYELTGTIHGQLWNGQMATGTTTQTIYTYWNQEKVDHLGIVKLGQSHVTTPEPSTLGLLGTGLVAMAGVMRRRVPR